MRASPCEPMHALVAKVADRITAGAPQSELQEWLRCLLSYPTLFIELDGPDAIYTEANSLREDARSTADSVALTTRQLIHSIVGFKKIKESASKQSFGAQQLCTLWSVVRISKSSTHLCKKSTFDTALTINDRIYDAIPGAEDIICSGEKAKGAQSFWNQIWKLQEIIYRANKKDRINWVMLCIQDYLASGRFEDAEITLAMLKTGHKSMTDVMLTQFGFKTFLLGKWLDSLELPAYMTAKAREIFDSHKSFRQHWHPIDCDDLCDLAWLFTWPKFGKKLLDFLEGAIYLPTLQEEAIYRSAVRNSTTPQELVAMNPWKDAIADIRTAMRTTAEPDQVDQGDEVNLNNNKAKKRKDDGGDEHVEKSCRDGDTNINGVLDQAVTRLMKQQSAFLLDPNSSFGACQQVFEACPLALLKASTESGNSAIMFDCNAYGVADHRPDKRVCPIHHDKMSLPLRAIVAARHGTQEPTQLNHGEFYVCINGGKDRKRQWTKTLINKNMKSGRDKNRTFTRNVMMHFTEKSWRSRKTKVRGQCKLTQQVYMTQNACTYSGLRHKDFMTITGSTRSDVMGPIDLDPMVDLPTMPVTDRKEFYGKRIVLVGGRVESDSSDHESISDDENQPVDPKDDADPPINPNLLPTSVAINIMEGFSGKHIIDLTPTPLPLAYEVIRRGGSYVALCATEKMQEYLKSQLKALLLKGIRDPTEKLLFDPRFRAADADDAGHHIFSGARPI